MLGGQGDLRDEVARNEHGTPLGREGLQHVSQPDDAFRVEPVHRLIEDERGGVAEQCGADAEPLTHAERVGLGPLAGDRLQSDQASASSTRRLLMPLDRAR